MSTQKSALSEQRPVNNKSFMDDQESLDALISCMSKEEQSEYRSYGSLTLESAFPDRKMIVYTIKSGQPSDIVVLNMGRMFMDPFDGPKVEVAVSTDTTPFVVEMIPKRIAHREVFLHVPQNFVFKWKGRFGNVPRAKVQFVPHYAILMKCRSQSRHSVEGHTYCVRLNNFKEQFPTMSVKY